MINDVNTFMAVTVASIIVLGSLVTFVDFPFWEKGKTPKLA